MSESALSIEFGKVLVGNHSSFISVILLCLQDTIGFWEGWFILRSFTVVEAASHRHLNQKLLPKYWNMLGFLRNTQYLIFTSVNNRLRLKLWVELQIFGPSSKRQLSPPDVNHQWQQFRLEVHQEPRNEFGFLALA